MITIHQIVLPNWDDPNTSVELWWMAESDWIGIDGTVYGAGNPETNQTYVQRVTGLTVDTGANTLTIPQHVIPSTRDAIRNPSVKLRAYIMAINGSTASLLKQFPASPLNGFTVPPTIVSETIIDPALHTATWSDLIVYATYAPSLPRPTYLTADDTYRLVAANIGAGGITGLGVAARVPFYVSPNVVTSDARLGFDPATGILTAPAASSTAQGIVTASAQVFAGAKRFADVTTFIQAPAADGGQGNTNTFSLSGGSDSSAASPLDSNDPSMYFQTIRSGGAQNVARFGFLYNFQTTGVAAADTYGHYVLSRVSSDLTNVPSGASYHLATRSYIVMRPTNVHAGVAVVGYGAWLQGEVQFATCAAYGAQIDCNNMSGSHAEHEDFSSVFKLACIATNFTSNANSSAIIYSQGATNGAAYKGWKISPNAAVRHLLDFQDAYYTLGGTVSVTNGSGAIVGTSTTFLKDLVVGDQLQFLGVAYTVVTIPDNTHATISPVYAGSTNAGLTVAKYVVPLRMAAKSFITASNGTLEFRAFGLDASNVWQFDPDQRGVVFGGIVQVPSPLQFVGNTAAHPMLKALAQFLALRRGDDSGASGDVVGNLPIAGAGNDGIIGFDLTNNRLVYYVGGNRFYIAGTGF